MENSEFNKQTGLVPGAESAQMPSDTLELAQEATALITKLIQERDPNKTKDLTYLFNQNQTKKTLIRQNKLNDLLDVITDQAMVRFTAKPDEISNKELLDGLKTVQDMLEKGQKQVTGAPDVPLIQINQHNTEVNMQEGGELSRESRERVTAAIAAILGKTTDPSLKEVPIEGSFKDNLTEVEERTLD